MDRGFISVWRSILDHPLWRHKPFQPGQAWVDMVMRADYRTGVLCESHRQLGATWGWEVPKVRRFLNRLQKESMIQKIYGPYCLIDPKPECNLFEGYPTHKSTRKPIHICISNYWRFQRSRHTKRHSNRHIHNNKDNYLFPNEYLHRKQQITVEGSQPISERPKKPPYRETHPQALHLASLMISMLRNTDNGELPHTPKIPPDPAKGRTGWASIFRLMIERDKCDPNEIKETLKWLYGQNLRNEVSFCVMAPKSLRAKWDNIQFQRRKQRRYL